MRDIVMKQVVGDGPGWCAWHDGEEDDNHSGWGATPAEAIDDLQRLDQERAEALEPAEHIEEGE